MRRVVWSDSAVEEFSRVVAYIAHDNPVAAISVADRLEAAVVALAELPIGRKGRVADTYEKVVSGLPYIIAYALSDDPPPKAAHSPCCMSFTAHGTGRKEAGRAAERLIGCLLRAGG